MSSSKTTKTKKHASSTFRKRLLALFHSSFWFLLGGSLGLFFFVSFVFIHYKNQYANRVFPGVYVGSVDLSGKSRTEVVSFFQAKNEQIQNYKIEFVKDDLIATTSASELNIGYDAQLLAEQAITIGRGDDFFANAVTILDAYLGGKQLPYAYTLDEEKVTTLLKPFEQAYNKQPVDALFSFDNNRVETFKPSMNGAKVDATRLKEQMKSSVPILLSQPNQRKLSFTVPVITLKPEVTTEEVNDLGIVELVGRGTSRYVGSIPNRIYNLSLAASRLNGVLIAPGETFSFNKTLGDVSKLTGYKEAYVIQNGRTVLGDGGGVCQVSTTFFRALLDAGLPIVERNPHAYRVHYYEEDSLPGVDAAIYTPNIDLRFKNDTGHHLLVQAINDPENLELTFELYGTKDGREVTLSKPVILSTAPAPEPLFIDDPTLPKGQVKQVDFAAPGAKVYFTREVRKNGKVILSDTFHSSYRPWQAVYMKGTKEG